MTEEQLKRIEEFKKTERYRAWSASEQATFVGLWKSYMALRAQLGPDKYISRAMLGEAYGTRHQGTPSKFMRHIEDLEDDQPSRGRRAQAPRQPASSEPAPPAIQTAFDGIRKTLEAALNAVMECRAREGQELSEQYQRLQREYLAAADAREQALSERIADLETASSGAGAESWDNAAEVDELRSALRAVTSQRDAETTRADQATTAHQLALAQRAAAEAQVQASEVRANASAADVVRLAQERDSLADAATRAAEMGLENSALRERAVALGEQITRLESLIIENERRHQQEREALRAQYAREFGGADRRAPGWLGAPVHGDNEGERG